jgi:galactokinase
MPGPEWAAPAAAWRAALASSSSPLRQHLDELYGERAGEWVQRYGRGLDAFEESYGADGRRLVISRCPGQMNIAGMHIDYGGMPSLRLAVRGHDTVTIAAPREDDVARFHSLYDGSDEERRFEPLSFRLSDLAAQTPIASRQDMLDYAGHVCTEREQATGTAFDDSWGILPQGGLVYLDSWLRRREVTPQGIDALVISNVSPSGGMSSSSALVISTAWAYLGLHDVLPGRDMPWEEAIDGVGTSEWIRGTRGGTADHGGMTLGRAGQLVSVGVFPAQDCGAAPLPDEYVAVLLDSGVPRIYDEAGKDETVLAYPVGAWLVRDVLLPAKVGAPGWEGLVPDFRERIDMIRDITPQRLGITTGQLCELLAAVPAQTTLSELEQMAAACGASDAWTSMHAREIGNKFSRITPDTTIHLRRRFVFGLAEQDRVGAIVDFLAVGDVSTAFELVRLSHAGDYDVEVTTEELAAIARCDAADPRGRLAFVPGGYGRMTPDYDRVVCRVNDFLRDYGEDVGAVQRIGAGWGGNFGGLISRRFFEGDERRAFESLLRDELQLPDVGDLDRRVAVPGQGTSLLPAPA